MGLRAAIEKGKLGEPENVQKGITQMKPRKINTLKKNRHPVICGSILKGLIYLQ